MFQKHVHFSRLNSYPRKGVTIGFVGAMYGVAENEETVAVIAAVLSGELSGTVVVRLTTKDGSAEGEKMKYYSLCSC